MLTSSPELGSFQDYLTSSNSSQMQSPLDHAPRKVPIHLQDAFHEEIRNLEQLGILEENKGHYRVGEQLCNHGKEASNLFQ